MNDVVNFDKRYRLERPITGVIHEDRIWESWYDPQVFETPLPKMNQTDYMFKCNEGFESQVILNNRGLKTITVEEFRRLVDIYYMALKSNGVKEGDMIATIALTTPELIALKYACAKVGAITSNLNFKDAYNGNLEKQLDKICPKIVFVLDLLENIVSDLLNKPVYKEMKKVVMPLEGTTPLNNPERLKIDILKVINAVKRKNIRDKVSLKKFWGLGTNYEGVIESAYHEGLVSNIAFTSGTTGVNKAVLLTHDANNALAWQHKMADLGLQRGMKNLALVPPFLAIWDADIIHTAMSLGLEDILELELSYENIPKLLKKHLPNFGIWSQFLWDSYLTMSDEERRQISPFIEKAVVGGERGDVNQANRFYKMTGLLQEAGYGCTEVDSCFSVAHPNCNVLGSAGLPLPYNNVRVMKDGKDLTYNERGRLYITGPCLMAGYYNDDELTRKVIKDFNDGKKWYDTGDYGFVDKTGSLTVMDRYGEAITIDSEQIQKADIAEVINGFYGTKICKVDYYNDSLVCHIVLDNYSQATIDDLKRDLVEYLEHMTEAWQPHFINIMDSLPRTPLGKVSYPELAKITKDIVDRSNCVPGSRLNICNKEMSLILSK